MKQYRIQTLCLSCNAEYLSRAKETKKPPVRCKECKSSKTTYNPQTEENIYEIPSAE